MVNTSELYRVYLAENAINTTTATSKSGILGWLDYGMPQYDWNLQDISTLYADGSPTWRVKNGYQIVYDGVPVSEIRETIKNRNMMDAINKLRDVPQKVNISESQIMEIL